jgi:hypothetical protein
MLVTIGGQSVPLGGDIVLSVQGLPASAANLARIRDAMSGLSSGTAFKATILRAGEVLELTGHVP